MTLYQSILRGALSGNLKCSVTSASGNQVPFSDATSLSTKTPQRIYFEDPGFLAAIDPTSTQTVRQNNMHSSYFSGHQPNHFMSYPSQTNDFAINAISHSANHMRYNPALAIPTSSVEIKDKKTNENGPVNNSTALSLAENWCSSLDEQYRDPIPWQIIDSTGITNVTKTPPSVAAIPIVTGLMVISSEKEIQNDEKNEIKSANFIESPHSTSIEQSNSERLLLKISKSKIVPVNKRKRSCFQPLSTSFPSDDDYEFSSKNHEVSESNVIVKTSTNKTGNSFVDLKTNYSEETSPSSTIAVECMKLPQVIITIDENFSKKYTLPKLSEMQTFEDEITSKILNNVFITKLNIKVLNLDHISHLNEHFFKAISKLKNLEVLKISASMLHYDYKVAKTNEELFSSIESSVDHGFETSAFLNVTTECKNLKTLHITDDDFPNKKIIPEYFLMLIKNFSKLENLKLANIPTCGKGDSLPLITRECKQLKSLKLKNVCNLQNQVSTLAMEICLLNLNNCKLLFISVKIELSQKIIYNLCQCFSLKTLILIKVDIKSSEAKFFGRSLQNLNQLKKLKLRFNGRGRFLPMLYSCLSQLKQKNSSLEFNLENEVAAFNSS